MTYDEAMQAYSKGELPFEELMDMKAELIHEENLECKHPTSAKRVLMREGVVICDDCGEEVPSMFSPDGDGRED